MAPYHWTETPENNLPDRSEAHTPPPPEFVADMAIFRNFKIPASVQHLTLPEAGQAPLFIAFISSILPSTGQPWCSDVEAALPSIITAFSPLDAPPLAFVEVGQKPEWKAPDNVYRMNWNIRNIPTVVRYELQNGIVVETGRLIEGELLDSGRISALVRQPVSSAPLL